MSTRGVGVGQQMFKNHAMGIGSRIKSRLDELGWQRKHLYDALPDLTAQALSNLIVRDSARSEWDERIAAALGVSVLWLVYGRETEYAKNDTNHQEFAQEEKTGSAYNVNSPQTVEILALMRQLPIERQDEVLRFTRERIDLESKGSKNSTRRTGQ